MQGNKTAVRVPPQNIEAEQALLGTILIQEKSLLKVAELLSPEDFYRDSHKLIYAAALSLFERSDPHDLVMVTSLLQDQNRLEQVGGIQYLYQITDVIPFTGTLVHHARVIREKAILRRLIQTSTELAARCYDAQGDIDRLVDRAEQAIFEVAQSRKKKNLTVASDVAAIGRASINAFVANKGRITGVSTGLRELDRMTHGLQPSSLVVIAARPSMGKTTLLMDIIRAASINNKLSSLFFSIEMPVNELALRMISSVSGINSEEIKNGCLDNHDIKAIDRAVSVISGGNYLIDDTVSITALEMRAKARRVKSERGLDLVAVDYLQLMQGNGDNRNLEISEITRSLKIMARELDVPVIALSQLNRSLESRTDKRPMMSDLRESGAIEQEADIVLFIYRDEVYNKSPDNPDRGTAELIIAKHRNGPTGTVKVGFNGATTQFLNLSWRDDAPR
jgi:replicative DNA helicase